MHPIIPALAMMGAPYEAEKSVITSVIENRMQGMQEELRKKIGYKLSINRLKGIIPVSHILVSEENKGKETPIIS